MKTKAKAIPSLIDKLRVLDTIYKGVVMVCKQNIIAHIQNLAILDTRYPYFVSTLKYR